jgi:hypothetical protein
MANAYRSQGFRHACASASVTRLRTRPFAPQRQGRTIPPLGHARIRLCPCLPVATGTGRRAAPLAAPLQTSTARIPLSPPSRRSQARDRGSASAIPGPTRRGSGLTMVTTPGYGSAAVPGSRPIVRGTAPGLASRMIRRHMLVGHSVLGWSFGVPHQGWNPRMIRATAGRLTFRSPLGSTVSLSDGPCDPGSPCAAPQPAAGLPRSHGPAEGRVERKGLICG